MDAGGRAMQEQLPRVAMHGLEKSVRDPENTSLKAPASKNLCNVRVYFVARMKCNEIREINATIPRITLRYRAVTTT
jgi:hypothetical protein